MASVVKSFGLEGITPFAVNIECSITQGSVAFDIIGLPDAAVKESKERVRSALKTMGISLPYKRIVINLAPANVRKSGSIYDVPILVAILSEMRELPTTPIAMIGELSLGGEIRPVKGVLPMILEAESLGIREVIIPRENAAEGRVCNSLTVYAATHAQDIVNHIRGIRRLPLASSFPTSARPAMHTPDMSEVKGQALAKKALEIAAAGGHNLLMIGPPGSGKSMLAKRLPSILPPLTEKEQIATTKIYSIAGLLGEGQGLIENRPFRSPHHNISNVGLTGGGTPLKPGEISLAHNGMLFLDELPEYPTKVIESLRQPLEDGEITIARVGTRVTFPSNIMLVAAMNPCPCGYFGVEKRCTCTASSVERYMSRVSGPMLDRFDIHTTVSAVSFDDLQGNTKSESSADILERVTNARDIQTERYKNTPFNCNSQISPGVLQQACRLEPSAQVLLSAAFTRLGLSARGHDKILKLARTIADLDSSDTIRDSHIAQAIQLRTLDRRSSK